MHQLTSPRPPVENWYRRRRTQQHAVHEKPGSHFGEEIGRSNVMVSDAVRVDYFAIMELDPVLLAAFDAGDSGPFGPAVSERSS
jgi:hypothetical protein